VKVMAVLLSAPVSKVAEASTAPVAGDMETVNSPRTDCPNGRVAGRRTAPCTLCAC
jgi:hypothetical protein